MRKLVYILFLLAFISNNKLNAQLNKGFKAENVHGCIGLPIYLKYLGDTAGLSFNWNLGNGYVSVSPSPVVSYESTGFYTITLVVGNGITTDTVIKSNYIQIHVPPDADFTFDSFYSTHSFSFYNQSVLVDSIDYTYLWTFGDGDSLELTTENQKLIIPDHTFPLDSNLFEVTLYVTDEYGCVNHEIKAVNITDSLQNPNVFTPNGDGIDDLLFFVTDGNTLMKLTVFNRWGAILYTFMARKLVWDGRTSAGLFVENGVYYYVIEAANGGSSRHNKAGFFHVFR